MGGRFPVPYTLAQALQRASELSEVLAIVVTRDGKFWRVIERRLRRPDGTEIEVNRHYRVCVAHCQPPTPPRMNDEVPY